MNNFVFADPKAQEAAENLRGLIGRTLVEIEVVPLGVMFHFSSKNDDNGVVYWAYGGPIKRGHSAWWYEEQKQAFNRTP